MTQSIHSVASEIVYEHNKHIVHPPTFTCCAIKKYFRTRFSSLWVGKAELSQYSWCEILNPFQALTELNLHHWNFFLLGFWGWTWDAFDFFVTSLNVTNIATDLNVSTKDVTWGITLVLMFRTVGAVIFGSIGDTFGRKWPYIINMLLLMAIQVGTGFVTTYQQFLGVRALFGIAMGGIYGNCAAEALSDAPKRARGVLSGIFQEGYAFGYLLAVCFQRAFDNTTRTWQNMFFFSAGVPVIFIIWRFINPETDNYQRQKARFEQGAIQKHSKVAEFTSEAKRAMKAYWLIIIYMVFMMSGFNFSSHGSQDLYPTMLIEEYNFGHDRSTVVNVCANLGAIVGGIIISHASTFIGRRAAILIGNVTAAAFIYPWAFKPMWITAFFMQFGIQGSWSVVPIHLNELAPPQFKSVVVGTSYQLGNLVSSASATIEATMNETLHDYDKTMAIFLGAILAYLMPVVFFGPENRGADLGVERDDEMSIYDVEGMDDEKKDSTSNVELEYSEQAQYKDDKDKKETKETTEV